MRACKQRGVELNYLEVLYYLLRINVLRASFIIIINFKAQLATNLKRDPYKIYFHTFPIFSNTLLVQFFQTFSSSFPPFYIQIINNQVCSNSQRVYKQESEHRSNST